MWGMSLSIGGVGCGECVYQLVVLDVWNVFINWWGWMCGMRLVIGGLGCGDGVYHWIELCTDSSCVATL